MARRTKAKEGVAASAAPPPTAANATEHVPPTEKAQKQPKVKKKPEQKQRKKKGEKSTAIPPISPLAPASLPVDVPEPSFRGDINKVSKATTTTTSSSAPKISSKKKRNQEDDPLHDGKGKEEASKPFSPSKNLPKATLAAVTTPEPQPVSGPATTTPLTKSTVKSKAKKKPKIATDIMKAPPLSSPVNGSTESGSFSTVATEVGRKKKASESAGDGVVSKRAKKHGKGDVAPSTSVSSLRSPSLAPSKSATPTSPVQAGTPADKSRVQNQGKNRKKGSGEQAGDSERKPQAKPSEIPPKLSTQGGVKKGVAVDARAAQDDGKRKAISDPGSSPRAKKTKQRSGDPSEKSKVEQQGDSGVAKRTKKRPGQGNNGTAPAVIPKPGSLTPIPSVPQAAAANGMPPSSTPSVPKRKPVQASLPTSPVPATSRAEYPGTLKQEQDAKGTKGVKDTKVEAATEDQSPATSQEVASSQGSAAGKEANVDQSTVTSVNKAERKGRKGSGTSLTAKKSKRKVKRL